MKSDQIQKYQMLERVHSFGQAHLGDFPKGSAAGPLIKSIGSAVTKLKAHATKQVSDAGAIQQSGSSHQDAKKALKTKLDSLFQTARVLKLSQFFLPRQRTDAAYIAAGESFAELAKQHEQQFVEQGLPLNFIVALSTAVADLQQAALNRASSKADHSSSIADFSEVLKQAMADLKRFDALVKNTMSSDAGTMASWKIARHVARTGAAAKTAAASPPAKAAAAAAGGGGA